MENIFIAINNQLVEFQWESFDVWCKNNDITTPTRQDFHKYCIDTLQSIRELEEEDVFDEFMMS